MFTGFNESGENVNKTLVLLEAIKNGMIWVMIPGVLGDILLFYSINSNQYIISQISSLGIQQLWLFIIWPAIVFLTAAFYAGSIEYGKLETEEEPSRELNILGLDRNWRTATNYLCAVDVMVNKKRKAFNLLGKDIEKETVSFKERFEDLIKEINTRNKDLGKTIEEFAKELWKIRTPIVHYGRVPNKKELELIKSTCEKIIKYLSDI